MRAQHPKPPKGLRGAFFYDVCSVLFLERDPKIFSLSASIPDYLFFFQPFSAFWDLYDQPRRLYQLKGDTLNTPYDLDDIRGNHFQRKNVDISFQHVFFLRHSPWNGIFYRVLDQDSMLIDGSVYLG